jgi:hypothetical protein
MYILMWMAFILVVSLYLIIIMLSNIPRPRIDIGALAF